MELINSISLLVLLAMTIAQESYELPIDRDGSTFKSDRSNIDESIMELLNDGFENWSPGNGAFDRASESMSHTVGKAVNTAGRSQNMFFDGYNTEHNRRNVARNTNNVVYFPEADFAATDDDFERILANLFEESRQATLDKMANRNGNIEKYLVDTDIVSDSSEYLRAKVMGNLTPECAICLEDYESATKRASLKCGHTFHRDCLKTWLRTVS